MKRLYILLTLISMVLLASCGQEKATIEKNPNPTSETSQQGTGTVTLELKNPAQLAGETLNFEVKIEKISKWEGNTQTEIVENNDNIEVHYTGTLENGEKFDSSYDRNQTLPFTVGAGQMIPGFDAGVVGIELNETKTLVLPPEQAYGPATIRNTITTQELRNFVWPDFDIVTGATIPTAWGAATIVEIQN